VLDDENLLECLRQLTSSSPASTTADHGGVRQAISRSLRGPLRAECRLAAYSVESAGGLVRVRIWRSRLH